MQMNLRYTLLGGLALGLLSTAAIAQDMPTSPEEGAAGSTQTQTAPTAVPSQPGVDATATDPMAATAPAAPAATAAGVNASSTTDPNTGAIRTTISNPPVADTPAARREYGGPNSRAGRRTAAAGN
jgi:hypothetical protein